jgi:regulator of ribonuclease activity A
MKEVYTADLWDAQEVPLRCLHAAFNTYGLLDNFCGPVLTLKVYEDNSYVRKVLAQPGKGRVLVIDGGGSCRCALLGDNLAQLAIDNQWNGLLIYGAIRDSKVINQMAIAVKALGTCPIKSIKRNVGVVGESLEIEGCTINTGDYIYADADGLLFSSSPLL